MLSPHIFPSLLFVLLAPLCSSPVHAQEVATVPAAPAVKIEITPEKARPSVRLFRETFATISRKQSFPTAISFFYTDDYKFVGVDGKTTTREQLLAGNGGFRITTAEQSKEDLKAEGGKAHELAEKDRQWKPEKYEISGDEVIVYSYPVSKNTQPIPDTDGRAKNAEIKTLMTVKETFLSNGKVLSKDVVFLKLKRVEILGAKMYINGKAQPASVLKKGDAPVL